MKERGESRREPGAGPDPGSPEETLDPVDWEDWKALGHRMVEDMGDYLSSVRERPVWKAMPESVRASLARPLPLEAEGEARAYEDFVESVLPYPLGNIHPRFWGWVNGSGAPIAVLAELLAAAMNPNTAGFDQSSTLVERQVLEWLKEMIGFPAGASGILVSGGSMANLVGLTVARDTKAGFDVRRRGLGEAPCRLTIYSSRETHSSVPKAAALLGLGTDALRLAPTHPDRRVDVTALRELVRGDRARGERPLAVVGNAGTIDSGAIDDLDALADLCDEEDLWLHVDGAFGALAALSPELRPLLRGMERADSLAFDLHKWMYLPYDVGCVLIRRDEDHRGAFELTPAYLSRVSGGVAAVPTVFGNYGVELSRSFRALKVWMCIKAYGAKKLGRMIEQNVEQAAYLAALVEAHPKLELLAPVALNVVCFRFAPPSLSGNLDRLNERILVRLQESGVAVPSSTRLDGDYAIRVANTNHRSRREDFRVLTESVARIGTGFEEEE